MIKSGKQHRSIIIASICSIAFTGNKLLCRAHSLQEGVPTAVLTVDTFYPHIIMKWNFPLRKIEATSVVQAFGFFAVLPVMTLPRFREMHRVALARQWKGILAVGSFIGLNIVLNNLSLVSLPFYKHILSLVSLPL